MRFVPGGAACWAVAGVVVTSVLAGCTGESAAIVTETPVPVVSESETPSPSPSASAAASAPLTEQELLDLLPEDAVIPDLWGAQVTAVFFLEQYGPMFQTGDTRVWEALSAEGCEYCEAQVSSADEVHESGWSATGGVVSVLSETLEGRLVEADRALVLVDGNLSAGWLNRGNGDTQEAFPASARTYALDLRLRDAIWMVSNVATEER